MTTPCTEWNIPINQAAEFFPQQPAYSTVWRWVLYGVSGRKLESRKIGGSRFTSRRAIHAFIEGVDIPSPEPSKSARKAAKRADDELSRAGW